ncbi:hypothetical protein ACVV7P_003777, partial [Cronobacter sakazakii]
ADCPQGEAQRAESIPPSPPYSKKEPELTLRLFCFYIAPGKRQVRFAYLPYKTAINVFVGWVSVSAPTFRPQTNRKNKKSPTHVGLLHGDIRRA